MTEHDSDQLVLREAMTFRGPTQPLDPNEVIERARRRRSRHRAGAAVAAVAMTASLGVGAAAVIGGLRQPEASTVAVGAGPTEVSQTRGKHVGIGVGPGLRPAAVETVGTDETADLGHGWTLTTRGGDTVCIGYGGSEGGCVHNISEGAGSATGGDGIVELRDTQNSLTLRAWLVPPESSTTVLTAEDGSRLPADVYALTEVPQAGVAVVFVESGQRQLRGLMAYDATGAVVADWPI